MKGTHTVTGSSRAMLFCTMIITIAIIAFIDFSTGPELSFSIFYLIPLLLTSLRRQATRNMIIAGAIIASVTWFFVEISSNEYSHIFYPIWNGIVRFGIFLTFGILFFNFKLNERRISEVNEKLQILNEEKNRFIGIASHDLRNPIGGVYSLTDLMLVHQSEGLNAEQKESLQLIRKLSSQMLNLTGNLLDVSRIESGNFNFTFKKADYIEFIREQVRFHQLTARQKEINIELETGESEIICDLDSLNMSQVIGNLLSNAIKYSPRGTVIHVRVNQNNGSIDTAVQDRGRGIQFSEQGELFNYFHRTSTRPTEGESSTGLGLAIAKKIVTGIGGRIGVQSIPGKGSTFYFDFPRLRTSGKEFNERMAVNS